MSFLRRFTPDALASGLRAAKAAVPTIGVNPHHASSGMPAPRNRQAMLAAYQSWTYAAARPIADAVAEVEWQLYRQTAKGRERIDQHPFYELAARPNPAMPGSYLWYLVDLWCDLGGDAYLWKAKDRLGVTRQLWPMMPTGVKVVPGREGETFVKGYIYQSGADKIPLEADEVVHIKWPNPRSLYYGMGVVEAARYAIDINELMGQYDIANLQNRGVVGGVISVPENKKLDRSERRQLREEWDDLHRGARNAGKLAILTQGAKYESIALSPSDLQYLEQKNATRDEIFAMFGTARSIAGMVDDINRANAEAAHYQFARIVQRPRMRMIRDWLTLNLIGDYDPRLILDFKDPVPEDRAAIVSEATGSVIGGLRTVDEGRALLGEEPLPAGRGEVLLWGINQIPTLGGLDEPEADPAPEPAADPPKHARPKAVDPIDLTKLIDSAEERRLAVLLIGKILRLAGRKGGETAADLIGISSAFDLAEPRILTILEQQANRFAADITATTVRRLRQIISAEAQAGSTVDEIADAIRDLYGDARAHRALIAARTEPARAYGDAQHEVYRTAGVPAKSWLTAGDDAVEEECAGNEAAGIIALSDSFPSGDETAPISSHPQCRCVVVPETQDATSGVSKSRDRLRGRPDRDLARIRIQARKQLQTYYREQQDRVLTRLYEHSG